MPYRDTPKITRADLPGYGKPAKKRQGTRSPLKDLAALYWLCSHYPADSLLRLTVGIRTVSEANSREHWAPKAKRAQTQRDQLHYAWKMAIQGAFPLNAPFTVTLTRIGPKKLDDDNNCRALKACRDQIAAELKIDDGSDLIEWRYAQEPGSREYRVCIEITEKR